MPSSSGAFSASGWLPSRLLGSHETNEPSTRNTGSQSIRNCERSPIATNEWDKPSHVAIVIGTRPEAIKLAPVCRALGARGIEVAVVLTGQHRELVDDLLVPLEITKYVHADLEVMKPRQDLSGLASSLFERLGSYLAKTQPDAIVVQGDTTSALCGAIAGFHERIPVAHVEAGLRSGNLADPFPEELNRQLITRAARWQFAPTANASENLKREDVDPEHVHVVGNTVVDSLQWVLRRGIGRSAFSPTPNSTKILVTLHRRETRGAALRALAESIGRLAQEHDAEVVFPVHPSPDVRDAIVPVLGDASRVRLREPLGYFDFLASLAEADLAISDSGGVQEEAPTLGTPVLIVRETTERSEAIAAGCAILVGTDPDRVGTVAADLLADPERRAMMSNLANPFGDGRAAERIADQMLVDLVSDTTEGVARDT